MKLDLKGQSCARDFQNITRCHYLMMIYYNNWILHCSYFMITRIQSSMLASILLDTFKFPNLNSFNMLYPQYRTLVLPCNGAQTLQSMLMSPKSKIQCMQGTTRITTAMRLHHVFNLCYACPRQYW